MELLHKALQAKWIHFVLSLGDSHNVKIFRYGIFWIMVRSGSDYSSPTASQILSSEQCIHLLLLPKPADECCTNSFCFILAPALSANVQCWIWLLKLLIHWSTSPLSPFLLRVLKENVHFSVLFLKSSSHFTKMVQILLISCMFWKNKYAIWNSLSENVSMQ